MAPNRNFVFQGLCSTGPGALQLGPNSNLEGDADPGHQNGIAAHFRDEFVGRLVDDGKGPIMAGDHPLELRKKRLQAIATVFAPMVKRSPIGTMPMSGR